MLKREDIARQIAAIPFKEGQEIKYISKDNSFTFLRFGQPGFDFGSGKAAQESLITSICVSRSGSNPRPIEMTIDKLFSFTGSMVPNVPVDFEKSRVATGNDRSLMLNILLLAADFRHTSVKNRQHIVWCPYDPHPPGEPALWCPVPRWQVTPEKALMARRSVLENGVYDEQEVSDVLAALRRGHVAIHGAPGCGKNHLLRLVCEALGADIHYATVHKGWGAHSIMGSFTSAGGNIRFVQGPLPRAISACIEGMSFGRPTFLMLDEMNRADADEVLGPLMTALGENDGLGGMLRSDLDPDNPEYTIPPEFRLIAAFNATDSSSVNVVSKAVWRRFGVIRISMPPNEDDGLSSLREWDFACGQLQEDGRTGEFLSMMEKPIRTVVGLARARLHGLGTAEVCRWMRATLDHLVLFGDGDLLARLDRAGLRTVMESTIEPDMVLALRNDAVSETAVRDAAVQIRNMGLAAMADRLQALALS